MEQWREDVLIHYGVKGMKWRHRKKSNMSDLERSARAYESSARADRDYWNSDDARKKVKNAWRREVSAWKNVHARYSDPSRHQDSKVMRYQKAQWDTKNAEKEMRRRWKANDNSEDNLEKALRKDRKNKNSKVRKILSKFGIK